MPASAASPHISKSVVRKSIAPLSVAINLSARFMDEDRQEHICWASKMSLTEVQLATPDVPRLGERVILYVDDLGRFSGVASRVEPLGFTLETRITSKKRDVLSDRLMWFANRHLLEGSDARRYERVVPFKRRTLMRHSGGGEHLVHIVDLSAGGAAINASHVPDIASEIVLGKTPARVVRHFDGGFGCAFLFPFDPHKVDEAITL